MRRLITLVNDDHGHIYLKDILAFVYYGSIVNNWAKSVYRYPTISSVQDSSVWTFICWFQSMTVIELYMSQNVRKRILGRARATKIQISLLILDTLRKHAYTNI